MYNSETLQGAVADYMYHCKGRPTMSGLASWLSTSASTISHVVHGYYGIGLPYTNQPHVSRIISNQDFPLIRSIFCSTE